jgi:hypothetical protein
MAMPPGAVAADVVSFAGLAWLVAAAATAAILFARDGLRAWLLASGIVCGVMIAIVALRPQVLNLGLLCGLAGLIVTAGCSQIVGRSLPSSGHAHGA